MAAIRLCHLMTAEETIQSPLWKRIICVHTQRLQKVVFSCPCPGEASQGLISPCWLQVPHVRWAGEGSKEGSKMGICIPSRAGKWEEGSYHPSSSHLCLLPWEKKKSSKGTGGFLCTSYAPVKFSSIVLLVLDQVQTLYGQSLCCVSVWVIH